MKFHIQCDHCGHKRVGYTYRLNVGTVTMLRRLVDQYEQTKKPVENKTVSRTKAEYTNLCHLQYWGLIAKAQRAWVPTPLGIQFIYGEVSIPDLAGEMNSVPIPYDHPSWQTHKDKPTMVTVRDIDNFAYKQRVDFEAEKSSQTSLL